SSVKRSRVALAVAVAAVVAIAATTMASGSGDGRQVRQAGGAPTWASVAPIFAEKCSGCHTPGGIAPFSLLSARSAKAHPHRILVMTKLGRMPPWMPGHDSPEYLNQSRRILTQAEKQLLARWVQGGARIGAGGTVKPVGATSTAPGTTMSLMPTRSYMPKAAV